MKSEDIMAVRKGVEITEFCLGKCNSLRFDVDIFQPNQEIMDKLLADNGLKMYFNGNDPSSDILIFHDSKDKYGHNGNIRMTCYLTLVPEVLKNVLKHQRILTLVKKIKQRKEVNK